VTKYWGLNVTRRIHLGGVTIRQSHVSFHHTLFCRLKDQMLTYQTTKSFKKVNVTFSLHLSGSPSQHISFLTGNDLGVFGLFFFLSGFWVLASDLQRKNSL
jgi:hypothetical protein